MKIGLCLSSAPGYSETFIRSKIKGLIAKGFKLNVFLFNRNKSNDDLFFVNPFPVKIAWVCIPFILLTLFLFRSGIALRFVRLERSDGKNLFEIVKALYINAHIFLKGRHDWLHFSFATVALGHENVAQAIGAKLAVSIRGFDIGLYPITHPGCYKLLWTKIQKLHTISDDLYELAIKEGLPSSVPVQKIRPAIHTDSLLKKEVFGNIHQPVRILSVGRLEWKKGFVYALQAMYELHKRGIDFTYQIVGSGTTEQELRYAIRDFGLENKVSLLGKASHRDVFKLMKNSDIYIQPSIQEGFCNALLEAQGIGLLCIATNAEGLSENIIDKQTGWIVPKRDPFAIASKVEEIMAINQERRIQITKNAMVRIDGEFKIERLVKEFQSFYSQK